MLGLLAHRSVPIELQPGEVLEDRRGILVAAPRPVDILEAEQKAACVKPRRAPPFERRADMAEMQIAGRARREARHRRAARLWHG
jgi:hypothetical protein